MGQQISFITHQKGTQGSYLNHLDLQQYLKDVEGYKINFFCESAKKLFQVIKDTRRNYKFAKGEIKILEESLIEPNVVITDFKTLIQFKKDNTFVACKKLLIFDCIELTYHLKGITNARFFYDIDLYEALKCFYADEIIFLMPPSNYKIFKEKYPDLNAQIFFKHINTAVLKSLNCNNHDGYFYRWDDVQDDTEKIMKEKFGDQCFSYPPTWAINKDGKKVPLKYNESKYIFDYKKFIYRRRKYLEYQEQLGRLIFEYILLDKTVYFLHETHTDDGLTDYLNYYDIKFKGMKVVTTKKELAKKMEIYTDRPWKE